MKPQWNPGFAWGVLLLNLIAVGSARADLESARLRNELGIIHVRSGHLDDGLRNFSLILAEFPSAAAALNNAANVYFLQGDTEQARALYERAIEAAPEEGGVYLNLGILLHTIGEEEASANRVRKGLALVGDLQHAYFLLGLSRRQSNQGRASDRGGLDAAEIEALLAKAMAEVPDAEPAPPAASGPPSENVTLASRDAEQKMETRPGGAKAEAYDPDAGVDSQRLFWMDLRGRP